MLQPLCRFSGQIGIDQVRPPLGVGRMTRSECSVLKGTVVGGRTISVSGSKRRAGGTGSGRGGTLVWMAAQLRGAPGRLKAL
ncbi:hypothetical protein D187_005692 [Cystobacter fuscus DSM 2262]|uniref:Uncharacterized protein n=1 Tax=Cystobacter fuscus (strain ATCC 25194 / DSM 2262 / NBRC 100088 / M29) TaxID=1242864 RepID=S9PJP2_CYSF2|nr:hypothetical protein D187_005692 [Cystobacter fuscus DSM 2262]